MYTSVSKEEVIKITQSLRWCVPQINAINPNTAVLVRDAADILHTLILSLDHNRSQQDHVTQVSWEKVQQVIHELVNQAHEHTHGDINQLTAYLAALSHLQERLQKSHDGLS